MTTLSAISTVFQNTLIDGQLVVTPDSLAEFPLADVFAILQTDALSLQEATLTALEDSVTLAGKVTLLGADQAGLTLTFAETEDTISFDLSAMLPVGLLPGAAWLSLEAMEIALQIVGRGSAVTGGFSGRLRSGDVILDTQIQVSRAAGAYSLEWTIAELDLGAIATLFLDGATLPEELPSIAFADVTVSLSNSGDFALRAVSAGAWEFPASGGGLTISEAAFSIERSVEVGTSNISADLSISGSEPVAIAADFALSRFALAFEFAAGDWQVDGEVAAQIFDTEISLAARYAQMNGVRALMLTSTADLPDLISLESVGRFGISTLALAYSRPINTPAAPAEWSLAARAQMQVEEVFSFDGTLTLARTATTTSLEFSPVLAEVVLPLPPTQQASMTLAFGGIAIERRDGAGATRSSWSFAADVGLSFEGWHPEVQARLPETINASFQANSERVRVTADRLLAPFDFEIPDIEISDLTVPLGAARIDVSDLAIALDGGIELSARIGVGLPAELNNLLGVNQNGEPSLPLFNTFDPENPEATTIGLQLAVNASAGLRIIPQDVFLKAVESVTGDDGRTYWRLNLGDFGEVQFLAPIFAYDTARSSFQVSGGFDVVRPLSLPLTPVQRLLEAVGLGALANGIPNGLPIKPINIVDDQGDFQTEELVELLEQVTNGEFPDELGAALNVIGDRLERLPEDFRQYLHVEVPDSFFFDLAVTPSGEVRLDARVQDGDPPVRLLSPSFTPLPVPLPALNGVELRSLSFGTLSGGSLFLLQIDADLDQFDLLTLAGSLLLPEGDILPLPNPQDLHRRLELNNLFMIVVYQTGIPIPVPLFYDNLGLQYLGLEGIGVETRLQFPQPSLNLAEVGAIARDFGRFFSDPDFLLDPNDEPEDFNLRFSFPLPNNYLQLPEYLGGQRLGSVESGVEIDAYRNLAHLLNGIKTFSINRLIQAVPLEHRVDSATVNFGPMALGAGWLITTPGEFQQIAGTPAQRQLVYDRMGFTSDEEANAILAIAPRSAPDAADEEGLVTLLRGSWTAGSLAQFDAAFGLAASGSQGFSTGFRIAGEIDNFLDVELAGRVAINAPVQPQVSAATEEVHYGLGFDGQDDYVQLNSPAGLNFDGTITLEAWIRPQATDGIRNIIAHGHRFNPNGEVFLRINHGRYEVGSWDGRNYLSAAPMPPEDIGNWVHLAGVYDGSHWRLYRNGVQLSMAQASRGAIATEANWAIGARGTGTERFFQGSLDEVRIWNRARTASEIQASRSQPFSGPVPGLVGYWSFDEGTGTLAGDRSGNGHNGTVQGAQWSATGAPLVFVDPDAPVGHPAFQLEGHSHLTILNHRIFTGDVQVVDDEFQLRGDLNLFPPASPLQVNGRLAGSLRDSAFNLNGHVQTELAGLTLAEARGLITNNQVFLQGSWLGVDSTLSVIVENNDFAVTGEVAVDVPISVNIGAINEPITGTRIIDGIRFSSQFSAGISVHITSEGFSAVVGGSFRWNDRTWQLPSFEVNVAFQDIADLARQIVDQIRATATDLFRDLLTNATAWLRAVRNGVVEFAGDVATGLRDGYRLTAQAAAQALQAASYTGQQVGVALRQAFSQTAQQAANILRGLRYDIQAIGSMLQSAYDQTAQQAAQIFRNLGYAAQEVGAVLQQTYRQTIQQATSILRSLSYAVVDVGRALQSVYRQSVGVISQVMRSAGYLAREVGQVLATVYGQGAEAASRTLRSIGYQVMEVGQALQGVFNAGASTAADILRRVGYAVLQVGSALQNVYRQSAADAARILRSLRYSVQEVGNVLRNVYNQVADVAARTLHTVGYAAKEVGQVLQGVYHQGASAAALTLRSVGYTANQIGETLEDVYNQSAREVERTLRSVGYGAQEVGRVLEGVFGQVGDGVEDVVDDIGDFFGF